MGVVELAPQASLVRVHREPHARDHVYACLDARGQLLVLSQRMRLIHALVRSATREKINLASLYEAANHKTRSHRAWTVRKLTRDELPAWLTREREAYDRVAICTDAVERWEVV